MTPPPSIAGLAPPCASGCTDTCPGGAAEHTQHVRASIVERIQREWPVVKRSSGFSERPKWKLLDEPGGLPPGWEVVSTWVAPDGRRATDAAPTRLHVVHARAREASRGTWRQGFRDIPAAPGVWGLAEQRGPGRPDLRLSEVTLWRLWQYASDPRQPYWPMPWGGWDSALEWLFAMVVDRFDLADENERAEHTLYLLSGRIRTPPADACI